MTKIYKILKLMIDSKTKGCFLITFCKRFCWFQKQKIIAGIFIAGPKGVEVFNHKC